MSCARLAAFGKSLPEVKSARGEIANEHRERQRSNTPLPCARSESIDDLRAEAARVTGGVGASLAGGATVGFGGELGGIGGNTQIWTFTGRARIPF